MKLRLALAQINPTVGDLEGNCQKIREVLEEAKSLGADLVTFPELALTGYPPEDLLLKKSFIKENVLSLRRLLPDTGGLTCIVGFADSLGGNLYNAAALLSNGKLKAVYHKNHLPNYGVFDEKRYFAPGERGLVFSLGDRESLRIGVSICEDLWVENGPPILEARQGGAKLLVNISASPYEAGKGEERRRLFSCQAKRAKAFLLYNNLVGGQDELIFDGGSMIFDDQGRLIERAPQFEERVLVADLEISSVARTIHRKVRQKARAKRRTSIVFCNILHKISKEKPSLPEKMPDASLSKEEEIYQALVLGTRDYVRKNRFQKVVLGLSGGIDSSLVACIAVDALGKDQVIGVSMPSGYSSFETGKDAKGLAENLGIRLIELPIESVFRATLELLSGPFRGKEEDVAEENLQARIRGVFLMALSNKFGWLVLTTGNKSEMSTGYCTLYGDMAGGFAVIKDVPKTWVYQLAKFRNQKDAAIPMSVLTREPTAELKPGQKDSDTLPRYEILDPILEAYIEQNVSLAQMKRKGLREEVAKAVIQKVDQNEYKRRQGPPGIKITPRAFGRDWRFPITNLYRET